MKRSIIFIVLLGCVPALYAREKISPQYLVPQSDIVPVLPGDSIPPLHRSKFSAFFSNFHLELPMLEISYCAPLKNKNLTTLPYGMDKFMYPVVNTGSPGFHNYCIRWIAIYYKDKIGIELYSDGFGASVNMDGFNRYMTAQFPNYYTTTDPYFGGYGFTGQSLGIAYKLHWRSFILEPKFLLGFESLNGDSSYYTAYLKQQGSNQFTEYAITQSETPHRQHSYHGRLLMGYRFHVGKERTEMEVGTQWEYIYSPYTFQTDIAQKPYGQPEVDHQLTLKETWRQFNVGLYVKVYLHRWIY